MFTVTLSVPKSAPTEVRLSLADGTGGDGTDSAGGKPLDYTPPLRAYWFDAAGVRQDLAVVDGAVVLPSRLTSFFVSVPTVDDFELERREVFTLTATLPEGVSDTAEATILDDGSGTVYRPDGTPDPDAVPSDDRPRPPPAPPAPPPLPPAPPAPPPPSEAPPPPAVSPFNSALLTPASGPGGPGSTLQFLLGDARPGPGVGETLTSSAGFRAVVLEASQPALLVFRGITDQFVEGNRTTTFNLPADAFAHTRPEAVLTLEAKLTNGLPLPGWMRFDAQAGTFTVAPPERFAGTLEIRVAARDNEDREAVAVFKFNVGEGVQPSPTAPAPAQDTSRPQSRSAFSDQVRQAQGRGGLLERILASRGVQQRLAEAAAAVPAGEGRGEPREAAAARPAATVPAPAEAARPQAAGAARPAGV